MQAERPDDVRLVLVTAPDEAVAGRLAEGAVEARLAACVNLVPGIVSVYRWQGSVERDGEVLLVVKTTAARLPALEAWLLEAHPYDCPEFVALAAEHVSGAYQAWLRAQVEGVSGA